MKTQTALLFSAMMLTTAPAFAQDGECSSDADCPDNFSCQTVTAEACPGCAGEDCPPCETSSYSYCEPGPPPTCDPNQGCEGDDVCVTYTFESCSGREPAPTCVPDEPCEAPEPDEPECTSESESYCVPPFLAPCQADADCGEGFTCEAVESCACSGSGSVGPDGETMVEESCSCEPTGENYCHLIEVECDTDSDCIDGMTCQESYEGDIAIACPEGEDCPQPEPVDPVSYCAPEAYGAYGRGEADYGGSVASATGREDADVTNAEREEFFPGDGSASSGSGEKSEVSGCSTASAGDASLLGLLFGALFVRRRR